MRIFKILLWLFYILTFHVKGRSFWLSSLPVWLLWDSQSPCRWNSSLHHWIGKYLFQLFQCSRSVLCVSVWRPLSVLLWAEHCIKDCRKNVYLGNQLFIVRLIISFPSQWNNLVWILTDLMLVKVIHLGYILTSFKCWFGTHQYGSTTPPQIVQITICLLLQFRK